MSEEVKDEVVVETEAVEVPVEAGIPEEEKAEAEATNVPPAEEEVAPGEAPEVEQPQ